MVQGPLAMWTVLRCQLATCSSLDDAIGVAASAIAHANKTGPIADYYNVVPVGLRRATFNYAQVPSQPLDIAGVNVTSVPRPFPTWKRPWELHVTIVESPAPTKIVWTGSTHLFQRATVARMLVRYLNLLAEA
jgi:hypothetical protein